MQRVPTIKSLEESTAENFWNLWLGKDFLDTKNMNCNRKYRWNIKNKLNGLPPKLKASVLLKITESLWCTPETNTIL